MITPSDGKADGMGTLIVRRPNDAGGHFRRLKVFVDGTEVAGLRPTKAHTVEVSDGLHKVHGQMDWAASLPLTVEVAAGAVITVEASLPFSAVFKVFYNPKHAVQVRQL